MRASHSLIAAPRSPQTTPPSSPEGLGAAGAGASTTVASPLGELAGLLPFGGRPPDRRHSLPASAHAVPDHVIVNLAAQFADSVSADSASAFSDAIAIDLDGYGEPFSNINDVRQIRNNPDLRSTEDCLAFVFSCVRNAGNSEALDRLVQRRSRTLLEKGIDNKDKLCDLLQASQRWDLATGAAHGMASGAAFNLVSAAINEKAGDMLVASVGGQTPGHMSAVGAGAGFALSVGDVASQPAVKKTFLGAYFTRPENDLLPPCLLEAAEKVKHTMGSKGRDLALGFVGTYGGRNLFRFFVESSVIGAKGGAALAGTIDRGLDVGGGLLAASAFKLYANARDQKAGRAGLHLLCGREDFAQCIDALRAPAAKHALSVAKRFAAYGVNVVTQLPAGLRDAFATAEAWTSHLVLTAGFGGALALQTGIRSSLSPAREAASELTTVALLGPTTAAVTEAFAPRPTPEEVAALVADGLTKCVSLPALYGIYGKAMAFVAFDGPNTISWPYPYSPGQLADAASAEIERRRGEPVTIEMPPDIIGEEIELNVPVLMPEQVPTPRTRSTTF
jgi:hypothetical protein